SWFTRRGSYAAATASRRFCDNASSKRADEKVVQEQRHDEKLTSKLEKMRAAALLRNAKVRTVPVQQGGGCSLCSSFAIRTNLLVEMASGLKVNFWKSGLCGVNVSSTFLEMVSTFLNCKLGTIPFKYLGLPIGANPKNMSTWDPLLEHLRN
ncbi:putative non-LTR retroelement reverse transcriptase, partial [Trifolium medium]|nr:putative non-LTR retroelement reverse transcriptase [Trifolium medium]